MLLDSSVTFLYFVNKNNKNIFIHNDNYSGCDNFELQGFLTGQELFLRGVSNLEINVFGLA